MSSSDFSFRRRILRKDVELPTTHNDSTRPAPNSPSKRRKRRRNKTWDRPYHSLRLKPQFVQTKLFCVLILVLFSSIFVLIHNLQWFTAKRDNDKVDSVSSRDKPRVIRDLSASGSKETDDEVSDYDNDARFSRDGEVVEREEDSEHATVNDKVEEGETGYSKDGDNVDGEEGSSQNDEADGEEERYSSESDNYSLNNGYFEEDCVPMHSWQTMQYPTCNMMHELVSLPSDLTFLAHGGKNIVFQLDPHVSPTETAQFVFKTQIYERIFGKAEYEDCRREALIFERLTWSPHIPPIYGFCGMSVLAPFASQGDLLSLIDSVRRGRQDPPPMDKLRIGIQAAEGLAALHCIDKRDGTRPSFAHNDLDPSQYIFNNGIFQISDFNFGMFILQDPQNDNAPCMALKSGMEVWKMRSPEDLANMFRDREPFLLDSADVFMLCNALYMLLTNQWLFEQDEDGMTSLNRIMDGERPPIPDNILTSTNQAHVAMRKAMDMCYHRNPQDRATSLEIATFLKREFCMLEERGEDCVQNEIVRVEFPPPINKHWDDDDYDAKMLVK